jgi:predicted RNA-binding protein
MKYWINVVSRDHVRRGVEGGFTQANHGKDWALKKMSKGDWLIFYSPKTAYENGEPLQAFTAIGQIIDNQPYEATMSPSFHPWRRDIRFEKVHEAPIRPLIEHLEFIENKIQWGYKFRFGVIEIEEPDFYIIKNAMNVQ